MGVVDGSGKHLVTISFIESDGTDDGSFDFFFFTQILQHESRSVLHKGC